MPKKGNKQSKKTAKPLPKAATANGSMKMTMYSAPTVVVRPQVKERRPGRPGGKRIALTRSYSGKARAMARRSLDPCDNSNDSGLGFDHHADQHHALTERLNWSDEAPNAKRLKVHVKVENDEINENYSFPEHAQTYRDDNTAVTSIQAPQNARAVPRCLPLTSRTAPSAPVTLTTQLQSVSKYMDIALTIVAQPEQQHRARYQTEGSRGAVKDRTGNGFPIVKLTGYGKPADLQVFIGSDMGKVSPHMFYQACRVSGKNSTSCSETKIDGTVVIEMQFDPAKDMQVTCDCVGILKERNVDVEHRFPDQLASRSKKKSTRCRMVFRTTITRDDGTQETLQVCSQPIICTQPPGIPEICKKSLTSCPASGGLELFIIGKNFLKDTKVSFQLDDDVHPRWEQSVVPDKEYLQQTHLVCVVPPYVHVDITEPVTVRLHVTSSGKTSESHQFVYTPVNGAMPSVHVDSPQVPLFSKLWATKQEQDIGMMPPPGTSMMPLRRSSMCSNEIHSPPLSRSGMKQELIDENSQSSIMDPAEVHHNGRYRHISESSLDVQQGDSNLSMINENSADMIHGQIVRSNINENSNLSIVNENSMEVNMTRSSQYDSMDESSNFAMSTARTVSAENLKVMDLTMKLPMVTAQLTMSSDLSTNAPSMATMRSFGVTSTMKMPTQSGQSVEAFLTNMEIKAECSLAASSGELVSQMPATSSRVFMNPHLLNATPEVPKADDVTQITPTNPVPIMQTPITTNDQRLNVLVNCAADTLIPKDNVLLNGDVIMSPSLTPMINTNIAPTQLATAALSAKNSPTIPPEVILNSQISPSMMCRNTAQDPLLNTNNLNMCQTSAPVDSRLLTTTSSTILSVTEPERAIILNAAADLLATTKKLNEMQAMPEMLSPNDLNTIPNPTAPFTPAVTNVCKSLVATQPSMPETSFPPLTMNGMESEKKLEDVLQVSTTLASMSENDLIDIINPSCFDQV